MKKNTSYKDIKFLIASLYFLLAYPTSLLSADKSIASLSIAQNEEARFIKAIYEIAITLFPNKCPQVNDSLEQWNTFLQDNFLRPKGKDHQDLRGEPSYTTFPQLMPAYKGLGLIDKTFPSKKSYDIIVIFGGTPWNTYERFQYIKELLQKNKITSPHLIYINGLRSLNKAEKKWLDEKGYKQTDFQHEAAQLIWKASLQTSLHKELDIMTIAPPAGRRANTEDTLKAYFSNYSFNTTLFITNAPYGPYQEEVVKGVVKTLNIHKNYEVIQSSINPDFPNLSSLDTIARRVYALLQNKKLH